jgi:hypothetical protein
MGEIGPVGGKNFVHGFTASVAVFAPGAEMAGVQARRARAPAPWRPKLRRDGESHGLPPLPRRSRPPLPRDDRPRRVPSSTPGLRHFGGTFGEASRSEARDRSPPRPLGRLPAGDVSVASSAGATGALKRRSPPGCVGGEAKAYRSPGGDRVELRRRGRIRLVEAPKSADEGTRRAGTDLEIGSPTVASPRQLRRRARQRARSRPRTCTRPTATSRCAASGPRGDVELGRIAVADVGAIVVAGIVLQRLHLTAYRRPSKPRAARAT